MEVFFVVGEFFSEAMRRRWKQKLKGYAIIYTLPGRENSSAVLQ
jgi:hypothetical protein